MDLRFVYILQKESKSKVSLILTRKMMDAQKVESRLHDYFSDKKTDPRRRTLGINSTVKIGISNNVDRRIEEITESSLKSGSSEWFSLNWLELLLLIALVNYYYFQPFLVLITSLITSIIILYYYAL